MKLAIKYVLKHNFKYRGLPSNTAPRTLFASWRVKGLWGGGSLKGQRATMFLYVVY